MDHVILVDSNDKQTGVFPKLKAHQLGLLHRAFSVFIFNDKNQLMLQRRANDKYHSGGLWTNTCCSHPSPGENTEAACHRRLLEEMGFDTELQFVTSFIYRETLDNDLTEHEFDHVYIGYSNEVPNPDRSEVSDWKFVGMDFLEKDIVANPDQYTIWFRIIFSRVKDFLLSHQKK